MKIAGQEKGEVKKKIVHNYHTQYKGMRTLWLSATTRVCIEKNDTNLCHKKVALIEPITRFFQLSVVLWGPSSKQKKYLVLASQ